MNLTPQIEYRKQQTYAAIKTKLKRDQIQTILPPLIPELFNWLEKKNLEPSGPPFFSYLKMEDEQMTVKVGIPVDDDFSPDDRVERDMFPDGKYAVLIYTGNYRNLYKVNDEFEKWAAQNNIEFRGPRTEFYPSDPDAEPDSKKWKTIIVNQIIDK